MEKTIKIGEADIKMRSSAAIPRLYRIKFRRDIFKDLNSIQATDDSIPFESIEIFENLAYIMAAHADPDINPNVEEWLAQFDTKDFFNALADIMSLWSEEVEQTSTEKKDIEQ